jgi:hypothetical protein
MNQISLTRLNITGNITEYTPVCVILEIAQTLYLEYDYTKINHPEYIYSVISAIKGCSVPHIFQKTNYGVDELGLIAKFVNSDIKIIWRRKKLLEAFNHLLKYFNKIPEIPTGEWTIGNQTMNEPLSYNACVLYKIVDYYGISTNRNTTINDMAYSIKLLSYSNEELLNKITNITKYLNKANLIDILCKNNTSILPNLKFANYTPTLKEFDNFRNSEFQIKNLEESYNKLTHPQALSLITPTNQYECIILAAKIYNIDISETENPYKEYISMKEGHYTPQDITFVEKYRKNPSFYLVNKNFRPNLLCLYNIDELTKFAKHEGFTDEDLIYNSPLELLQQNINTFYLGRHPDSTNKLTLITLEEFDEIDSNLIISYRYHLLEGGDAIEAFELSELVNHFRVNKAFIHPIHYNLKLSYNSVKKLKYICKNKNFSENIKNKYQELLEVIYIIENIEHTNVIYNEKFLKISDREILINNLQIILEMALYMRGWDGIGDYPLDETPYNDKNDENVYKAMIKYDEIIQYKELFDSMPLMLKKKDNNLDCIICSTNIDDGTTILEKINIIRENKSIHSCIRTSSNKFLWTYIFFTKLLGYKPKIDFFVEIA